MLTQNLYQDRNTLTKFNGYSSSIFRMCSRALNLWKDEMERGMKSVVSPWVFQNSVSLSRPTFAAMAAAVICDEELSSVEATPLSFFSSSSSSHWTPLSSVCLWGLVVGGGERGGGGEGKSSSSSCTSFTFTMASRKRSMAWGRAGSMNWKHSCPQRQKKK